MRLSIPPVVALALPAMLIGGCARNEPEVKTASPAPTPPTAMAVELTAYVPCGMTVPFYEAFALYESANPDVTIDAVYDNDAVLLKKVKDDGDRPDIFISPGGRELDVLADEKLVDRDAAVKLGSFEIVAVVARDSSLQLSKPEDLKVPALATIALPDADLSSMGWHVRQSLQQLNLWDDIQEKIVPANRIIEAYQQVVQGQVDLTFTYRGCPLPVDEESLAKSPVRIAFSLPRESYNVPMVTVGALATSPHAEHASQFIQFLSTERVEKLMVEEGLPDERGLTGVMAKAGEGAALKASSDADVYILAFYPDNEAHAEVRGFIQSFAEKHPGRVEVELHDFRDPESDPEGFQKWKRAGFGCAGILVNGNNSITLGDREVIFQRKMGAQWTKEDLEAAVESQLG